MAAAPGKNSCSVLLSWLVAARRAATRSSRERTSARMSSDCAASARQRWPSVRSKSASR